MVKSINSYKIHFNRNISDDINFRTFETMGCKPLLLTNYTPGLEELFIIGENIVVYKDRFDLIDKIKYYLENDKQREEMIIKGYDHVKSNHTYLNIFVWNILHLISIFLNQSLSFFTYQFRIVILHQNLIN